MTHLVTPRLLLSLLAATSYLGFNSLMRETLSTILRTIGPLTVARYLDFAIGLGIGPEEWEGQNSEGAKGLSEVAIHIDRRESTLFALSRLSISEGDESITKSGEEEDAKVGHVSSKQREATMHPSDDHSARFKRQSVSSLQSDSMAMDDHDHSHFYGFSSNKIGEACVSWLARWGLEVIELEMSAKPTDDRSWCVWSYGGIPAKFIRALLSSDLLFISNELERYNAARSVVELRRKGWELETVSGDRGDMSQLSSSSTRYVDWDEDEVELAGVFESGIYYTHMVKFIGLGHYRFSLITSRLTSSSTSPPTLIPKRASHTPPSPSCKLLTGLLQTCGPGYSIRIHSL
jgi:hypothetical protein